MVRGSTLPENRIPAGTIVVAVLLVFSLIGGCISGIPIPTFPNIPNLPSDHAVDGKLRVYFLDVGQGDSSVLLFGNRTVLIDAGDLDHGGDVIGDLRALGIDHIDLLVATHPHSDHIGGMESVLAAFPVTEVLDAGTPSTSSIYENFLDRIADRGIAYSVAEQGETINLNGLSILILSPPAERITDDINDNSIVLRVSYGTVDFLFTGDAGTQTEAALLKTGYPLDAEVLKVAHHGSSDATSAAFLTRVNPSVAVISAGAGNEYGHPHTETLRTLAAAGVTVYRTDTNGTILVATDGSSYSVRTTNTPEKPLTLAPPAVTTPGVTAVATVTGTGTNGTPFTLPAIPLGNGTSVAIAETRFNAKGDDRLNLNGEWVRLENTGNGSVLLAGWTLSDDSGEPLYTFPLYILDPGTDVTVYSGHGDYNDTALFMGRDEPVWNNNGDTAILKDRGGTVIDRKSEG